jgi:hypothetical protein
VIQAPPLYPDELLSSGLVQCYRWFNLTLFRLIVSVLGLPVPKARFLSACPLPAFAAMYEISQEQLLWEHTTFPYTTAFVSQKTFESTRAHAVSAQNGRLLRL